MPFEVSTYMSFEAYCLRPKGGYVFDRVGLLVCQQDYLQINELICINLLPKVSRAKEQSISFLG